ncbi:MAG: hypothetical protein ACFB4J_05255, partial [Elainellaceae cyanobacterium]
GVGLTHRHHRPGLEGLEVAFERMTLEAMGWWRLMSGDCRSLAQKSPTGVGRSSGTFDDFYGLADASPSRSPLIFGHLYSRLYPKRSAGLIKTANT